MTYLDVKQLTDLTRVKRDGSISVYDVKIADIPIPCQVLIRKMETHYRAEIGCDLRYAGGQWGFDHIFCFWTNWAPAVPQSTVFGLEEAQRTALQMDAVFTNVREAQRGVKDWLVDEDGLAFISGRLDKMAQVRLARAREADASAKLLGKLSDIANPRRVNNDE